MAGLGWIACRRPHRGCCCSLLPGTLVTSCPHTDNVGGLPGWEWPSGGQQRATRHVRGGCGTGTREPGTSIPSLAPPTHQPKEHQYPRAPASVTPMSSHGACLSPKCRRTPKMDKPQPGYSQAANTAEGWGYRTSCDSALTGHTPTWPWPCPLFSLRKSPGPSSGCSVTCHPPLWFLEEGRGWSEPWAATRRRPHTCCVQERVCVPAHVLPCAHSICVQACAHVCCGVHVCARLRMSACVCYVCVSAHVFVFVHAYLRVACTQMCTYPMSSRPV